MVLLLGWVAFSNLNAGQIEPAKQQKISEPESNRRHVNSCAIKQPQINGLCIFNQFLVYLVNHLSLPQPMPRFPVRSFQFPVNLARYCHPYMPMAISDNVSNFLANFFHQFIFNLPINSISYDPVSEHHKFKSKKAVVHSNTITS